MPIGDGVHRTSVGSTAGAASERRGSRRVTIIALATLFALMAQTYTAVARPDAARAASQTPKAVFIVGPTNGLTDSNLADAEKMAQQAEAEGMEVRRVFFPHATWDNVLANIQGANLVVYMGHGYGWPSPYTKQLTESRQNGMGLNTFDGSGKADYRYYGATPIRENIRLAPNAIVYLNHLCYAAGNAESGMAIPSEELARERVDNFANGWLAAGARAVFAYSWNQKLNHSRALMQTNQTMDELFMTPAKGGPNGFIGWRNNRFASQRIPGAMNHLDPHPNHGYYRALSGDLNMTAAEWRASAAGEAAPPGDPAGAPQITSLEASGSAGFSGQSINGQTVSAAFHPNGDGLDEELLLRHSVTKAANLDVTVTNGAGNAIRTYSVWSPKGAAGSRWNGRNNAGNWVGDGVYTLTYVPRATDGTIGEPVSTRALVLTAIKLGKPSAPAIFARDEDGLAQKTKLAVTLNQAATIDWRLRNAAGNVVRTVHANAELVAGVQRFAWDGRANNGAWLADGWYRSVVVATTQHGSYSQERDVYLGAYRLTPSISSPARGGKMTLTILSTEPLAVNPSVLVTQPGIEPFTVPTTKVAKKKWKATITLKSGGSAGTVELLVSGTDRDGGINEGTLSLTLR